MAEAPSAAPPQNTAPAALGKGAPAGAPAAPPVGAPAAAKEQATETIKVDGKEVKVTPSQLRALAQKGYFADQRLKSVDVLQGKTKALIDSLKTPEGLLQVLKDPALGASPKEVFRKLMASDVVDDELKEEMSRWVYDNVVVQSKKTPAEIETEKKLAKLSQLEKDDADRKAAALNEQQKAQVAQVYAAVRTEVTKQIVADKTFPKTEGSIRAVVEKLRVMNRQGAPITAESISKALSLVKNDHMIHQQSLLDAFEDPEQLISAIGEGRALKIARALAMRLKNKAAAKTAPKKDEEQTENLDGRNARKFGRERHGYQVMDVM
jgi:hypothetical protein